MSSKCSHWWRGLMRMRGEERGEAEISVRTVRCGLGQVLTSNIGKLTTAGKIARDNLVAILLSISYDIL